MIRYTSTELLESVRNLGGVGSTRSTGSRDEDLLRHLNESLREKILPEFSILQEEYFIRRARGPVNPDGRAAMHSRASWDRLRDLATYETAGSLRTPLSPSGYSLEGNDIVLAGTGPYPALLEQKFIFRPGDLVLLESTRTIVAVNPATFTVTLDSAAPAGWDDSAFTPAANPTLLDVHSPESGAEIVDWSMSVASIVADTVIFSVPIDGSTFGRKPLAVGQFVVLEGEAAIPGIPREWIPLLVRTCAARLAEAIGDETMIKAHGSVGEAMLKLNKANAEQRVIEHPMRVSGRRGALRAARGWW